jgi:hypothetical protein
MTGRDSADGTCNAERSTLNAQCSTGTSLLVLDLLLGRENEEDDEHENES